jgi:hypothetical protein
MFAMLLPMKNKVTDFALERQKRQKEIFRRPDSCRNIFLKSLRASAKVYTPGLNIETPWFKKDKECHCSEIKKRWVEKTVTNVSMVIASWSRVFNDWSIMIILLMRYQPQWRIAALTVKHAHRKGTNGFAKG